MRRNGRGARERATRRSAGHAAGLRRAALPAGLALLLLPGCGEIPPGGPQDKDERPGNYEVTVDATFAPGQKLAKRSRMDIVVRNVSGEVIPNVNVALGSNVNNGYSDDTERVGDFYRRRDDENQADPNRPKFVVNKAPIDYFRTPTRPEKINPTDTRRFELSRKQDEQRDDIQREVRASVGEDTTYVDTYDLGRLKPGETRRFRWSVTAVEAGPYLLQWRVQAGLDGKAQAVLAGGGVPRGEFRGVVEREAPDANVDFSDGNSVTRGGSGEPNGEGLESLPAPPER